MLTVLRAVGLGALYLALAGAVSAQDAVSVSEGPRFLATVAGRPAPVEVEVRSVSILHRRISLAIENERLKDALEKVGREADVKFVYSPNIINSASRISFRAENMTVAAVLMDLLVDAQVDVLLSGGKYMTLTPREPNALVPVTGTIVGTVTEAETDAPVVNAQVSVDGRGRTLTDGDGQYRIDGVEAGPRTVSVTSIGYASASREVEVGDRATITVDFALEVSASQLDQIVVTVTGEQRVRELGHVVGRINADSLVREAPISNLSQLLTGRVPGLQVYQTQGIVGGDVQMQVRTPNSLLLENEPIMIVDGVRYTTQPALDFARIDPYGGCARCTNQYVDNLGTSPFKDGVFNIDAARVESTSPLNDLNPNDIESIEVVKGPTAATLYGTDAANGVIVITTKRGRPGPGRWGVYVNGGYHETPEIAQPEDLYWAWGSLNGETLITNCALQQVAVGACQQDSIVAYRNELADMSETLFEAAPQFNYGLTYSGGTPGLRYYVSGSFQRETGPVQMPPLLVDSIEEARGGSLPEDQLRPNLLQNINLRSNLSASPGGRVDLDVNLGYIRRTSRTIAAFNPYTQAGQLTSDWQNGRGAQQHRAGGADGIFSRTSTESVDRLLLGGSASWRPAQWLQARATAGVDMGSGVRHSLQRRAEGFYRNTDSPTTGEVQVDRTQQRSIDGSLGMTASFRPGPLSSSTSLGASYSRGTSDAVIAWGTDLIPGGESVGQAANRFANQVYSETVTLGSYASQTFGLNDRLFLTGALRMDGASNFGQDYEAAVYPKASVSWIVSEEPFFPRIPYLDELRLRYAFGLSGQQAQSWMARPTFAGVASPGEGPIEGTQTPRVNVTALGNPDLRPERSREHEFGFDAAGFDNRVQLSLAWYRRRVQDQIVPLAMPPGLGSMFRNLGLTTARGFEAIVSVTVLDTRALSWDLRLVHSSNTSELVDGGDGFHYQTGYREGYPLDAVFGYDVLGYEDANGDGILTPSEIQFAEPVEGRHDFMQKYLGRSSPPHSQTLGTSFRLFNGGLRLSASFDRSAGHLLSARNPCVFDQCLAALDPSTPFEEQAQTVLGTYQSAVPADFTRLREVGLGANLPVALLGSVGVRSASVSLLVRNLALWTSFPDDDPESRLSFGGIPQARTWTMRFDLGF